MESNQLNLTGGVNTSFRVAYGHDLPNDGKVIERFKDCRILKHLSIHKGGGVKGKKGESVYTVMKDVIFQGAFRTVDGARERMKEVAG